MLISSICLAAALAVPSMPEAVNDDSEAVTNLVFDASRPDARTFSLRLELDATPSNNVEVVFGRDTDGDGLLSRDEEALMVGWDCGRWKVVDCASGGETAESVVSGHVALDLCVRIGTDAAPWSLEATAGGQPVFSALAVAPPPFLFSRDWNAAKVVCRGLDSPHSIVATDVRNTSLAISVR